MSAPIDTSVLAAGGNFLVTPELGLMLWTLIAFGVAMYLLRRLAYPRIQSALETRAEMLSDARRDIEQETRRAIGQIRREVADLTVIATEKVARKTLDEDDHKRLIDEALQEFDFSQLPGGGSPTGNGGDGSSG